MNLEKHAPVQYERGSPAVMVQRKEPDQETYCGWLEGMGKRDRQKHLWEVILGVAACQGVSGKHGAAECRNGKQDKPWCASVVKRANLFPSNNMQTESKRKGERSTKAHGEGKYAQC